MFQSPFSFESRIRRTEYGLSVIIYAILAVIIDTIAETGNKGAGIIFLAYIPVLWFILAQGAKRCHDRGNSGWYQIIPFYGLWMLFADSDSGINEYGSNPKESVERTTNNNMTTYKSSDNLGTSFTDHKKVTAAWNAQGMMLDKGNRVTIHKDDGGSTKIISKGHPYICYTFNTEDAARKGLSSISFIKIAIDTNELISLETLDFGYYETETKGLWKVIIWGESLTREMFEESGTKLSALGGKKKGERIPTKKIQSKSKVNAMGGKTTHVRTDVKGVNTYEVYKAPSKVVALEFLKRKSVTKSLYYVIIETPEGNWGKDIAGIYKE